MKLCSGSKVFLVLLAVLGAGCPGESTGGEPLKPPPDSGKSPSGGSPAPSETTAPAEGEITASDIEAAVEEAASKIDESNADAELDALEKDLSDD